MDITQAPVPGTHISDEPEAVVLDTPVDATPDVVPSVGNRRPGSLAARMQARHEDIAASKTQRFDVPGYGSFLQVELRAIPFEQTSEIAMQHAKLNPVAKRITRIQTDILAHATNSFHVIDDEGNSELAVNDETGKPETWKSLYIGAQREKAEREGGAAIPEEVAEKMNARAALTYFLGAEKIATLAVQYDEWRSSGPVQGAIEKQLLGESSTTRS